MTSAPPNIRTYRLEPTAFGPTIKRRLGRRLMWLVPAFAVMVGAELLVTGEPMGEQTRAADAWSMTLVAAFVLGMGFLVIRRQLKDQRLFWHSYELIVSDNVIRQHTANRSAVEILRPEVQHIVDAHGEGLTVATVDRYRFIFIPEQVVGYAEVRSRLSAWKELEPPKLARHRALSMIWSVLLVASWLGCGVIPDIRLAMASGAILLVVGGMTIREVLKLPVLDNKSKAIGLGALSLMLLAPFARLALELVFQVKVGWRR